MIQHKTLTAYGFKLYEKDNRGHHRVAKPQEHREGWVWCPSGPGRQWKRTKRKSICARTCGVGSGFDRNTLKTRGFGHTEIQEKVWRQQQRTRQGAPRVPVPVFIGGGTCGRREWRNISLRKLLLPFGLQILHGTLRELLTKTTCLSQEWGQMPAWVVSQQEIPLPPEKTNWENSGGAERREDTPAHSTSCYTNLEEFGRGRKEEGGDGRHALPTSQKPSRWNPPWLGDVRATRKELQSDPAWAKQDDWPETTRKLTPLPEKLRLRATRVLFPCCSPPRHPFLTKSFALSVGVSPRTIHFQVLDTSPLSGPGRGPPSCNGTLYFYSLNSHWRPARKLNDNHPVTESTEIERSWGAVMVGIIRKDEVLIDPGRWLKCTRHRETEKDVQVGWNKGQVPKKTCHQSSECKCLTLSFLTVM